MQPGPWAGYGGQPGMAMPPQGAYPASFQPPPGYSGEIGGAMFVDGPAHAGAPGMEGAAPYGTPPEYYGQGTASVWCEGCGGAGCSGCLGTGIGRGLFRRAFSETLEFILPYTDGGCCTQRWYDIRAEYMNLTREETTDPIAFTSAGVLGPSVLSTEDLAFEDAAGFRFGAAYQIAPGTSLEFSYFGTFNYASSAGVFDPTDNLFSVFSDFGVNPFLGFQETDASFFQSIDYSSTFDSFEMNYRRRWVGPYCRYQGSWLAGVRHFILDEDFIYETESDTGELDYLTTTYNAITGFQVGGDFWACLVPGIMVGAEAKLGIYGNRARQDTVINATTILFPPLREEAERDLATFIGEAGFMGIYRLGPKATIRAGYQFLLVDGVALASENFNTAPPFVAGARQIVLDETGEVYYHGATVGLEYMW